MDYFIPSSQNDFDHIINGFRKKTLPAKEWTHEAHLIAGLWHVANFSYEEALNTMRENIKDYNLSVGGQNTDSSGYHESITVFWVWLLNEFWQRYSTNNQSFEQVCNAFLTSKYCDRAAAFTFYTREKLLSREARLAFVSPDVQAFDFDVL
ncbi:hypothetical protein Emtol_2293 [Emticicia oligotrophica DSM 17448]|uniref:Uncharacterized protein n=1 Tax=Emticicia oligotrophica (strain DSM 17448 / CIP 109782 / MTCC 6937 / GPTSA100-15) TaxID=929562 RepID=A0ABN4AQL2_EMTOG|nr:MULTISPECIES: hypothetical protein [Emticicia]AFK03431.1 hypothetical protein Emtol_2293 [Emticicia oligotrophica DSM 17448]